MHTTETTRRQRARRRMQPPLASMIDVTFLLLVFFLLTFTFREQEGQIRANLGGDRGGLLQPMRISVHPAGPGNRQAIFELAGADAMTSPEELYDVLRARREVLSGESPISIKPARSVRWQHVVEAFNQAVRARFENVGLAGSS